MAFAALAHAGDNIVSTSNLYGGTYNQLKVFLPRLGITTKFVKGDDPEEFEKLIDDKTKAVYIESIGNPKYNVPDFEKIVEVAHAHGVPVVVSLCGLGFVDLHQGLMGDDDDNFGFRLTIHSVLEDILSGRLNTALTLSSIRQPNGSGDMGQQLAGSWWTVANSTGARTLSVSHNSTTLPKGTMVSSSGTLLAQSHLLFESA